VVVFFYKTRCTLQPHDIVDAGSFKLVNYSHHSGDCYYVTDFFLWGY